MHTTFHGDDSWAPDGSCRRGAASSSPGRSAGERARRLKTWLVVLLCSSPVSAWAQTPAPAAPPPTGDAPDAAPPAHDAPSEAPNDAGDAPPGTAEQAPDQPSPPPQGGQDTTTATPDAPAGTDAGAAAAPSGIQPPRLERFVAAALPEGTPVAEGEQVVLLQLTIDAGGQVTDATVLESSGQPAYDDAARSAALAFTFAPATRDGVPIPARIRYRYLFAPPKVERQTPKDAELSLRVLDLQGKALAGVEVWLLKPDGKGQSMALSDAQGRASLTQVPPGRYRLTLSLAGYQPLESAETLAPGEALALKFRLRPERPADDPEAFVATAVVDPPAREVTRRTIRSQELVRIPGTRGDALRAVELLPGVARPPFGAGLLIVRGSAPGDSETFIEGSAIPLVYHFGGLTSVVNSRLLERIDFYPGNFSVRYGRRIGGILDVGLRDPADDRLHGVIDLNIIDASVLAEGPVNDKLSVAVAARRSYIDFFFDALVPDDAFDVIAAPVYWDYQLIASYRPTTRDRVRVVGYGSSDDLRLILSEPADTDPNFRGDLNLGTRFHRVDAAWRRQLSDAVDQDISVSVGPNAIDFGAGPDLDFDLDFVQIYSRAEWRARLNSKLRLIGGFDLFIAPFTIETRGLPVQQSEGEPNLEPLATQDVRSDALSATVYRPATYLEVDWQATRQWLWVFGTRLDYFSEINSWGIDPRVTSIYSLSEQTRLKAGVGSFTQAPEFQESADDSVGNPALEPLRALHTGLGIEHDLKAHITLGAEGFYKHIFNRVVRNVDGAEPNFINDGLGRIYGLELSGRVQPKGRFFGFLSYTLSRSERNDRDEGWRLFDFDQTHIFTASGTYRLGRGWELGSTVRLVSGNPDTPVVGSVYDGNADLFIPINGPINSTRNPLFHRLDVRIEKLWRFQTWKLALYLDVQNAYNAQNREGVSYSFDYRESSDVTGLPIIPSLGIRGEL